MYAATGVQSTATSSADALVERSVPLWGWCLSRFIRLRFLRYLRTMWYQQYQQRRVERVNNAMAQMLAMLPNKEGTDWDVQFPHVESAYNKYAGVATGLAPNAVLRRLPLSVLSPPGIGRHQGLERDRLAYFNLATDRQQQTPHVRKHHTTSPLRA